MPHTSTIKKRAFSRASESFLGSKGACRWPFLASSWCLSWFHRLSPVSFLSSAREENARGVPSGVLSFFGCRMLTEGETHSLCFFSLLRASFLCGSIWKMSSVNIRRSTRLSDPSYRPRMTWNLPRIVSVMWFFFGVDLKTYLSFFQMQSVARQEDDMEVDNGAPSEGRQFAHRGM